MSSWCSIGIANFSSLLSGALSPPQKALLEFSEPWEHGHGYMSLGKKCQPAELIVAADFISPYDKYAAFQAYALMKDSIVLIRIWEGFSPVSYPNYQIVEVEDITDQRYFSVAAGGLQSGNYEAIVRFIVQQVTGAW